MQHPGAAPPEAPIHQPAPAPRRGTRAFRWLRPTLLALAGLALFILALRLACQWPRARPGIVPDGTP